MKTGKKSASFSCSEIAALAAYEQGWEEKLHLWVCLVSRHMYYHLVSIEASLILLPATRSKNPPETSDPQGEEAIIVHSQCQKEKLFLQSTEELWNRNNTGERNEMHYNTELIVSSLPLMVPRILCYRNIQEASGHYYFPVWIFF